MTAQPKDNIDLSNVFFRWLELRRSATECSTGDARQELEQNIEQCATELRSRRAKNLMELAFQLSYVQDILALDRQNEKYADVSRCIDNILLSTVHILTEERQSMKG